MTRLIIVLTLSITLSLHAVGRGWAQDPDIIVQGTKTGTPLDQLTGGATILDEAAIQKMRVETVADVLRRVEGLDVVRLGGAGAQTSLFVRGGNSNHTLVVIDGVKVNSPTTGAFDLAHLTVDQIERIEILRGTQSPLYGSEATAGVVNIVTKRGREQDRDSLTVEGGSYGTRRGTLTHAARGPVWTRAWSISRWDAQGFSKASDDLGNAERDGYANTTFAMKLGRGSGVGGQFDLALRLTDATTDIDDASSPPPDFLPADSPAKSRNKAAVVGGTLSRLIRPWWDHKLIVGWSRDHGTTGRGTFGNSDIDAQSRQLEWQHTLSLGPDNLVTAGYEYLRRSARYNGDYDQSVVSNSFFIHDQFAAFDPLTFSLSARTDGNNRFGRHDTFKIGSSLNHRSSGTRVFANYGTGFRGPTLNDLFAAFGGNPNVKPETSRGYEAGLTQEAGPLAVTGSYFHTDFDDLIVVVQDTVDPNLFVATNVKSAMVKGFETTAELRAPKSRILASYTYTSTHDSSTDDQLLRRPRNKAGIALIFEPEPHASLRVDTRYVGERLDVGSTLPSYLVTDVAASHRWGANLEGFVRADNLFDRDYEEVTGYGTAGRSVYAGVTARF
jgi:vitamin B12 transporter